MGFWDIVNFLEADWWAVGNVDDEVAVELEYPGVAPVPVDEFCGCDFHGAIVDEWVSEVNTDCLVQEKLGKIPPSSIERYSSAASMSRA